MVKYISEEHKGSIRQACKLVGLQQAVFYYKAKKKNDEQIREQLQLMAQLHNRWGFWMMYHRLRNMQFKDNHKRVYRIYTQMKLNLRRKHKRRLPARIIHPLLQPLHHNLTWSMDFMHDGLFQGKTFRSFNVIDDFNREVLTIAIDSSLTSQRVIRELDKLIERSAGYSGGSQERSESRPHYPQQDGYHGDPSYKHKKKKGFLGDFFDFD